MKNNQQKFDLAIIGGGPAGMMAAVAAAQKGKRIVLIEKNKKLGNKLLLTGKGRCNITQANLSHGEFIEKIGKNGRFLFSSLSVFDHQKTIDFFEKNGLETKIERGGRVFPVSDDAQDVLGVLRKKLSDNNVQLQLGHKVLDFKIKDKKIEAVVTNKGEFLAENFILCTGGKTYPTTGSTGDGYAWTEKMGHTVIGPMPALTPLEVKEDWPKELQGVGLKNVTINIFQNEKKITSRFGEMLFTHFGLSGPIILDVSKEIGNLLKKGRVFVEIDLKPALDFPTLEKRLLKDFSKDSNKDFKNYLPDLLPKKMIPVFLRLSKISPEKKLHSISKEERKMIIHLLKNLKTEVKNTLAFDQAIITSGGVSLREIDSRTMQSKIIENLFFAGEILDLDGPTGGFNLQICWTTGFVAGISAAEK